MFLLCLKENNIFLLFHGGDGKWGEPQFSLFLTTNNLSFASQCLNERFDQARVWDDVFNAASFDD